MMRHFMTFPLALMLALTPSLASAQTEAACLTGPEAQGLVQFVLPDVLEQISSTCNTALPATAFLIRSRADLKQRYAASANSTASVARQAFGKVAGIKGADIGKLDDNALRGVLGLGISGAISGKIKAGECVLIDDVLEALSPLPPENMAKLIGIALREGGKPKGNSASKSPFRLCGQGNEAEGGA